MLLRFRRPIYVCAALAVLAAAGGVLRLEAAPAAGSPAGTRAAALAAARAEARAGAHRFGPAPIRGGHWVAVWGAAPQPASPGNLSLRGFRRQTLRQIVFAGAGGWEVRVRLTNAFGTRPLWVGRASIAVPSAGASLRRGTVRPLAFHGRHSVLIPAHADVLSDPVRLTVRPLTHLAVSLYLPRATGPATQHYQARQVAYVAAGDRAAALGSHGFSARTTSWYLLDGLDVLAPRRDLGTVVALGDSITDGVGSPVNGDARWPNDLARRLAARRGDTLSVVDEGIGGNRVLNTSPCCGVSAVGREAADALSQPGVRAVVLLEGINDIGFSQSHKIDNLPHTDVSAGQIVAGYRRIIARAHAAGVRVIGATLLPFQGARYWTAAAEAKRQAVNHWILTSRAFDGVVDFASVLADSHDRLRLNPAYDSGDHLHPNAAGYRAMAAAVDLPALLHGR